MRDIVVIGASAGGIEAVRQIASQLRQDIPAAVFVVVHLSPDSSGLLPTILNRRSRVPAHQPEDKETIEPGQIYVAAPDRHMMLEAGRVRMSRGPKHNRHRPAIDLLFRTAARNFGERVIGVVLTGFLDDGSSGLLAIKNAGGVAIIQSPEDAEVAFMPRNALQQVEPDYCVPLREIGQLINLQILGVSTNNLTTLPPEIGQLIHLHRLFLNKNHLTSLSPKIGQLINLQILGLNENNLTTLPPEIGQLINLKLLDLRNNPLTALPPEIKQLTNCYIQR